MLGSRMHQQRVASRVNSRTVLTRIFAGKVHVVVVAHVAHDLAAQQAATPFVTVAHLLEELRDAPRFQFYWASKSNSNGRVADGIDRRLRRTQNE